MHDQQQPSELVKALELLERGQADVVAKAEAAAMWQTRAELLAIQLQQAHARIRALEAPREPTMPRDALQRPTDGLAVETAQESPTAKRPWWRFWQA